MSLAPLTPLHFAPHGGALQTAWAAVWLLGFLPVAFLGLGHLARRLMRLGPGKIETLPATGVAAFVFAAGILNWLRLARPLEIGLLLAVGLVVGTARLWPRIRQLPAPRGWLGGLLGAPGTLCLVLLASSITALTFALALAPSVYNWVDDLQKYFVHPVRMLETGTVFGSPLSAVGAESLGGIASLEGCTLLALPIRDLNGTDAILGLFLCLLPLVGFGLRNPRLSLVACVACGSIGVIDPFYVNVSALFLGSALIMAAVALSGDVSETGERSNGAHPTHIGLLYAAMVALKPTFLLFAGLHWVLTAIAIGLKGARKGIRWALSAGISASLFCAPWLLVHAPHYLEALAWSIHPIVPVPQEAIPTPRRVLPVELFGIGPLDRGLTGLRAYTVMELVLSTIVLLVGWSAVRGKPIPPWKWAAAVAAATTCIAYPFMIWVFPRMLGYQGGDPEAVRYFCPFVIGIYPIALCLAARPAGREPEGCGIGMGSPNTRRLAWVALGLAGLVSFTPTAAGRYKNALKYGTFLPFPTAQEPSLVREMDEVLDGPKQAALKRWQERVPSGATLVTWINTPFLLDYSRNVILDAEAAGISSPWARLPKSAYVLWEYRGFPDPQSRTRHLLEDLPAQVGSHGPRIFDFDRQLSKRMKSGKILFQDGEFVLFHYSDPDP